MKISGTVVAVLDGKTLTIEDGSKVTIPVQLQQIDVPQADDPAAITSLNILRQIALGKTVDFERTAMLNGRSIGKVTINGTDVSLLMIRNGGAWNYVPANRFLNEQDRLQFVHNEKLAQGEQRGIWAVADLKPIWISPGVFAVRQREFEQAVQAAKDDDSDVAGRIAAKQNADEANARVQILPDAPEFKQTSTESGFTSNADGDLVTNYDVYTDDGFISTPVVMLPTTGLKKLFAVQYRFKGSRVPKGGSNFNLAIAVVGYDDEVIIVTERGERFRLGTGDIPSGSKVALFSISRSALIAISKNNKALMRIGYSETVLDASMMNAIRRLLKAT